MVEEKAILTRSPKIVLSCNTARSSLYTGTDSPVKVASDICNCDVFKSRKSAGTISPASSKTISPTTKF